MAKTLGERVGDTVGLRVRFGSKVSRAHAHRGRHRGRVHAPRARRSELDGRRRRAVRRIPRALARCRSRPRAGARRAAGPARGPAAPRHVGDDRRRARRHAPRRRAGDRAPKAAPSRSRPAISAAIRAPIEPQMADAIARALRARTPGSVLAFLPGAAEIRRTAGAARTRRLDAGHRRRCALRRARRRRAGPRHRAGAAAAAARSCSRPRSPRPRSPSRACASSIDCGLARVPRYEPDVGLTRLETVRVSRAAADQRRGRAGRTEPGICYRLWDEPQTASLEAYARPEILSADLSGFALDLAAWGVAARARLPSSIRRRARPLAEAKALLSSSAPSTPTAASPTKGRSCGGCRCRRGSPAWWSMPRRRRRTRSPPRSRSLIGERGLGGDDVDLDASSRCLAPRPLAPRARCARYGATLGGAAEAMCLRIRSAIPPPWGRRVGVGGEARRATGAHLPASSARPPDPHP